MPLPIPIPHKLTDDEKALAQLVHEIVRRAMDGTSAIKTGFSITISVAGGGTIVTTPDGKHTYRLGVANNGAPTSTKLT